MRANCPMSCVFTELLGSCLGLISRLGFLRHRLRFYEITPSPTLSKLNKEKKPKQTNGKLCWNKLLFNQENVLHSHCLKAALLDSCLEGNGYSLCVWQILQSSKIFFTLFPDWNSYCPLGFQHSLFPFPNQFTLHSYFPRALCLSKLISLFYPLVVFLSCLIFSFASGDPFKTSQKGQVVQEQCSLLFP